MHSQTVRHGRVYRLVVLTLAGIIVTLLSLACWQSTEPTAPVPTFSGRWMGVPWQGDAQAVHRGTPDADTLYLFGVRPVGAGQSPTGPYADEVVRVRILFRGVGRYVLGAEDVDVMQLVGGDGISAVYTGIGAETGEVQITSYEERTGRLEGTITFDARLMRTGTLEPVVHFEDGQFQAMLFSAPTRN